MIAYTHSANRHTVEGARAALTELFRDYLPRTLLDVGCGTGTWLRAALDLGVEEVFGLDGVPIASQELLISRDLFRVQDLTQPWSLGRQFECVLCLEVAEHLQPVESQSLVQSLATHSSRIVFSAACPGQPGEHHVNCQWPSYWQALFNDVGYTCDDRLRWRIWQNPEVEQWYRQNIFEATLNPDVAGSETRIPSVIHPEVAPSMVWNLDTMEAHRSLIDNGSLPLSWYITAPVRALRAKIRRRFRTTAPDVLRQRESGGRSDRA